MSTPRYPITLEELQGFFTGYMGYDDMVLDTLDPHHSTEKDYMRRYVVSGSDKAERKHYLLSTIEIDGHEVPYTLWETAQKLDGQDRDQIRMAIGAYRRNRNPPIKLDDPDTATDVFKSHRPKKQDHAPHDKKPTTEVPEAATTAKQGDPFSLVGKSIGEATQILCRAGVGYLDNYGFDLFKSRIFCNKEICLLTYGDDRIVASVKHHTSRTNEKTSKPIPECLIGMDVELASNIVRSCGRDFFISHIDGVACEMPSHESIGNNCVTCRVVDGELWMVR